MKQHKKEHIQTLLPDLRARVLADAERHAREGDSYFFLESETILDKGIMPSEKVLDFPVDCNTLTGSVNL